MIKARLASLLFVLATAFSAAAQPCLSGWEFRVKVTVDNTANASALTSHQVKLVLNTQNLVVSGKMQSNGGDIRIQGSTGNTLPFWIENNTMNTPTTIIWVKMPSIAANTADSIYLFYGRETASSQSNGSTTFDFFDDFNGSFLDPAKWDDCGGGTITVAGGTLALNSSSQATNVAVKSATAFTSNIICEADVTSLSNGIGLMGQVNAADSGWAMAYEQLGTGNKVIRMVSTSNNGTGDTCIVTADQLPLSNNVLAGSSLGTWSFAWPAASSQSLQWPGGSVTRSDTLLQDLYGDSKHFFMANTALSGSIIADWVRVRKYTSLEPILTLGSEEQLVDEVDVSQTGPYCQGDTIFLDAPTFVGATYSWFGPNGYTSSDEDPVIPNATANESGTYLVSVALAAGCSPQSDSTVVQVSTTTVGGTLNGAATVCIDSNDGTLNLSGQNGDVLRWESASSAGGPWTSISITDTSLDYDNLLETTYYRIFVKSGDCPEDTSTVTAITVDASSVGGNLLGSTSGCEGNNSGTLNLINKTGTILGWELSTDTGATWSALTGTGNSHAYSDLVQSSWYRLEIKNGVCASTFSDTALIEVIPALIAGFEATDPCLGLATQFTDTTVFGASTAQGFLWDFGDGGSTTLMNPQHTFATSGNHDVMLIVTSTNGCVDTTTQTVMVHALPNVGFDFNNVCDTLPMSFQDQSTVVGATIAEHYWNFGDGSGTFAVEDTNHVFPTDGTYSVKHIAVSDTGCTDSISQTVTVHPRAYVSFTGEDVCHQDATDFTNNTQFNPLEVTYLWVLGDGNTASAIDASHTYSDTGTFSVTLQSTTNMGCLDFFTDTVEVFPLPEVSYLVDNECVYDTLHFINTSTIGSGTMTYVWSFGDGATDTLDTAAHLYAEPNSFFTTLDALSDHGCTGQATKWVRTYHKPVAAFSYEKVCETFETPFTNASGVSTGTLSHAWNFGDTLSALNTDSILDPEHIYTREGSFETELIVTTEFGCQDSITKTIVVFPLPNPDFVYTKVCDGFETPFADSTRIESGSVESYLWNFGDATSSILTDPTHLFLNDGMYQVSLKTTSDRGCVNDTTIEVEVWEVPVANFSVEDVCWSEAITPVNSSTISSGLLSYQWNFGDNQSDTLENPEHTYVNSQLYPIQLIATSQNGCIDSLLKYVETYALPTVDAGLDTNVSQGFETILQGSGTLAADYLWTPTTGMVDNAVANPVARPLETTTYNLLVTDIHGCQAEDQVTIEVIEDFKLLVQNLITPDGNGINDQWVIVNAGTFDLLNVFVYDRYGYEVMSQKGYNSDWGAVQGTDQLPDGTYYYVITFDNSDRVYKGSVSVMRNQ